MSRSTVIFWSLTLLALVGQLSQAQTVEQNGRAEAKAAAQSTSSAELNNSLPGLPASDAKAGSKISAELTSTVDAGTAKRGDEVRARVMKDVKQDGQTVVHKGDLLIGHINDVQTGSTAKAGTRLGITFNRLQSGSATFRLNTILASVLPTRTEDDSNGEMMDSESASMQVPAPASGHPSNPHGGLVGDVARSSSSTVNSGLSVAGSAAGSIDTGTVNATHGATAGVIGHGHSSGPLGSIQVEEHASTGTDVNSVLSTRHGDLRLESGTRLEFRTAGR